MTSWVGVQSQNDETYAERGFAPSGTHQDQFAVPNAAQAAAASQKVENKQAAAREPSISRDIFEVSELRAQLTAAQIGDRVANHVWSSCMDSWFVVVTQHLLSRLRGGKRLSHYSPLLLLFFVAPLGKF